MKSKVLNRSLLAGVVISLCSGLLAPAALAACAGTELSACPAPFDTQLPDTHKMLTWSQSDRVIGFRNDYRNYAGDVFHHGNAIPLVAAAKQLTDASYRVNGKTYHLQDYLQRQNVSGMLVLKDGKIAWKYLGRVIPTPRCGRRARWANPWSPRWWVWRLNRARSARSTISSRNTNPI
ncbi:6-aminohexanoate-dimer hydrolase domain protein [Serratia marcescens]|nr:6-aminohexanoate-dimer hydrolase domain protein [Serratia marcescens]